MSSARSSGECAEAESPRKKPRLDGPGAGEQQRGTAPTMMVTIGQEKETTITVRIPQAPSETIGGHLWPSAQYLSSYIHQAMRTNFNSAHVVLELGAGRCLSGVHLALLPDGPHVILTDAATDFVAQAHSILALNGITRQRGSAQRLCWGEFTPETLALKGRVDYIIAADVFYEPSDFELVFVTVAFLARPFLTSYQHRGEGKRRLQQLARKWRMKMDTIPFDMEDGDEEEVGKEGGARIGNRPTLELLLFTPI